MGAGVVESDACWLLDDVRCCDWHTRFIHQSIHVRRSVLSYAFQFCAVVDVVVLEDDDDDDDDDEGQMNSSPSLSLILSSVF